jgi:membrane fusion protein (multidrug efflux system)
MMAMSRVIVSVLLSMLVGCKPPAAPPQPPPPEVTVGTVSAEPVALDLTYAASTAGSREVEVRARVSGILLKRRYEEGARVAQGQSLFQIDPAPIRARAAAARAQVDVAKARMAEAGRQRDRVVPLFEQNAVSQSRRDEVVSTFEVAQANLMAAQADMQSAQLDLDYTDVRAPISGVTSREMISEGSLISMERDSMPLTRIAQVDPLYVEFAVPEAEAALIRASLAAASSPQAEPRVRVVLEGDHIYPEPAKLTFIDNLVDRESGTVRARAVLPNPRAEILPGQFVRARLEGVTLQNVVAIPRRAIMSNAQGRFVWLVGADAKVAMQPVQVGRSMGNEVIVTDGLGPGDRYVIEGVLKLQPGVQVSAVASEDALREAGRQRPTSGSPLPPSREPA